VHLEKSSLFHPNSAMGYLELLHVHGMREGLSTQDKMHVLNTMINLSAKMQVNFLLICRAVIV
jgi:hypothetical protein